ncbi:MAG: hypothetical protein F7B20_04785 [Aeropyrum sp.]|nr:hypothetical protein [Aeropyrum sp.]MCE4616770.1 hypothetical protein [Aeropyrum sp.]
MLERILLVVVRALFLHDLRMLRMGSLALTLPHTALVYLTLSQPSISLVMILVQHSTYIISGMTGLVLYSSVLASIPASWMAFTQALLDAASGGPGSPARYVEIWARSYAASSAILYLVHTLNPSEISYTLWRLTQSCSTALSPLLIYRAISGLLSEAFETITTHRLKGVPPWRTLAILIFRSAEVSEMMEEGSYSHISRCRPRPLYSARGLALQALILAIDAVLFIASQHLY